MKTIRSALAVVLIVVGVLLLFNMQQTAQQQQQQQQQQTGARQQQNQHEQQHQKEKEEITTRQRLHRHGGETALKHRLEKELLLNGDTRRKNILVVQQQEHEREEEERLARSRQAEEEKKETSVSEESSSHSEAQATTQAETTGAAVETKPLTSTFVRSFANNAGDDSSVNGSSPPPQQVQERELTVEELNAIDEDVGAGPKFLQATWQAVKAGREFPMHDSVVPVFVTPLFHDAVELKALLMSIDAPVRLFVFVWNSENAAMREVLTILARLPFGVHIHHHPENIGFSGAVNKGLHDGLANLTAPEARWFFVVNADASFPEGNLREFAKVINTRKLYEIDGLVYGPKQDHFAFVITRAAVDLVGFFDEVFYPGYMEDIDYHWRVRLSGLTQTITKINFHHKRSVSLKKPGTGNYKQMLQRAASNIEYAWQKWGDFAQASVKDIESAKPPSGFTTPFNIPGAPLSIWSIDPAHRHCIRTGQGLTHIRSRTCWYNGTSLLKHPEMPSNVTTLTYNLLRPQRSGALSKLDKQGLKDRRF